MVNPRTIFVGGKEAVKPLLEKTKEIIKSGKTEDKAKFLTKPKPTKIKVDTKEKDIIKDTSLAITKKDIKVKKPKINIDQADDALFQLKNTKIPPKVLKDFNINKIKDKGDFLKLIEIASKSFKVDRRSRAYQSEETTKRLATLLSTNSEKLHQTLFNLKPGDTLNAEYILAARELFVAGMRQLDDMAQKAVDGNLNEKQLLAFRQHFALMGEFQKILKGVQTETARALQQFNIPTRSKAYTNVDLDELNKQSLLIELGGPGNVKDIARLYLSTGSDVKKAKFNADANLITKASDSVVEVFLNAILSNPMTHVRNTGGNWITQGIVQQERKLASRLFGGKEEGGIAAYEDIARAFGKSQAYSEMITLIGDSLKKGEMPVIKSNFGGSKLEHRVGALTAQNFKIENKTAANIFDIGGKLVTLNRIPTRFLTVADNWFKNAEYRAELYSLAYRETMEAINNKTLKQEHAAKYLADAIVNPSKEMVKAAHEAALYTTYQTKLGTRGDILDLAKFAQRGKSNQYLGYFGWLTNYYLPFIQTPTNIAGFALERSPGLNLILKKFRQDLLGKDEAKKQIALTKLAVGSAFYLTFGTTGYLGYTSGSDPQIPGITTGGKRELQKTFDFQPKSIRIPTGDGNFQQFNLTGLDPVAMMMGMASDSGKIVEMALQDNDQSARDATAYALALTLAFGENITNSTFMMGMSKANRDLTHWNRVKENPEARGKFAEEWFNRYTSSFIPTAARQTGKFFNDDFNKIAIEWDEYVKRNIAEGSLFYDYDILGDKIEKFGFKSTIKGDSIKEEIYNVMPRITPIEKSIQLQYDRATSVSIPLNSEQYSLLKQKAGESFRRNMGKLMFKSYYQNEDKLIVKEAMQKNALSAARSEARAFIKKTYKDELLAKGEEIALRKQLDRQKGEEPGAGEIQSALEKLLQNKEETK